MRLPVPPPGALPQEKADNVQAKLSQGEYVLPAEVVRFYGLEKIESMVNKAKEGLQNMQEGGRIKEAPTDQQRAQGQTGPQPPQQPPMQPQGPMQRQAPVAANMGQPAPGFNQGGLVRTTLPDGRTIFLPPGMQTPTLGHNVMGGSAMQTVAKEQEDKKKEEAAPVAPVENPVGEGLNPGGESDDGGSGSLGGPGGTNETTDRVGTVESTVSGLAGLAGLTGYGLAATIGKGVAKGLAEQFGGSAAEEAGYGGGKPGDGSGGVSSSDTDDGVDDGVGSGVEGGMGTTGGHDDGGEDSGDDSAGMGEGGGAAAGGGPAGEAGNDADGDGNSDTGLKDGGFLAPPAVKKYKRKKKR